MPKLRPKYGNEIRIQFNSYSNFVGISRSVLPVEDVAKGPQGEQVGPGGPQQVGKHATNLAHVLNQAKVVQK